MLGSHRFTQQRISVATISEMIFMDLSHLIHQW
jgi:hypothetical protein